MLSEPMFAERQREIENRSSPYLRRCWVDVGPAGVIELAIRTAAFRSEGAVRVVLVADLLPFPGPFHASESASPHCTMEPGSTILQVLKYLSRVFPVSCDLGR